MATMKALGMIMAAALVCGLVLFPGLASAHCDALDGPVINDARAALEKGDVTAVLKWVPAEEEATIREAFALAGKVRGLSPEAGRLADQYFFETLVRVHREGEGASFTGIRPAGRIPAPIAKADQALTEGSVDQLADMISAHVKEAMHNRFDHALAARKHADKSIAEGRKYVEAYVEYIHFVEGIVDVVHGSHAH